MIQSFADKGTKDIFEARSTKQSRQVLPVELHSIAKRKLNMIAIATCLIDLKSPPNNRLEKLKGDLDSFHSIRINQQWRIVFVWENNSAKGVRICDYH